MPCIKAVLHLLLVENSSLKKRSASLLPRSTPHEYRLRYRYQCDLDHQDIEYLLPYFPSATRST